MLAVYTPMHDAEPIFGILEPRLAFFAVGFVLLGIGALWARRLTAGDPEIKSFWATDGGRVRPGPQLIAGLVLAATAIVLVAFVRP